MFALILGLTVRTHYALRRFMPTSILLDAIHTRRGLKWGVPAMLLAVPYVLAMAVCVALVEAGGSGWLNALALLFAWNALKFLGAGPVTLMRLLRVRGREAQTRRRAVAACTDPTVGVAGATVGHNVGGKQSGQPATLHAEAHTRARCIPRCSHSM